jgi:hypothetical protein
MFLVFGLTPLSAVANRKISAKAAVSVTMAATGQS